MTKTTETSETTETTETTETSDILDISDISDILDTSKATSPCWCMRVPALLPFEHLCTPKGQTHALSTASTGIGGPVRSVSSVPSVSSCCSRWLSSLGNATCESPYPSYYIASSVVGTIHR